MEHEKRQEKSPERRSRGGRPKATDPRSEQLAVMCTTGERKTIEDKAKQARISVSEFLRNAGLNRQIAGTQKTLSPEVLKLSGAISHMAANLNQIAKAINQRIFLKETDTTVLEILLKDLEWLAAELKTRMR